MKNVKTIALNTEAQRSRGKTGGRFWWWAKCGLTKNLVPEAIELAKQCWASLRSAPTYNLLLSTMFF